MASSKSLFAYRLIAEKWASNAFTGEGARLYGGRWNSPGLPVVYLGSTRSLCALELLVHLTTPSSRAKRFSMFQMEIPEDCIDSLEDPLPGTWQQEPPDHSTMQLGHKWLKNSSSLLLRVPSAIVPEEWNYLLNPLHQDYGKLSIPLAAPFRFDERL